MNATETIDTRPELRQDRHMAKKTIQLHSELFSPRSGSWEPHLVVQIEAERVRVTIGDSSDTVASTVSLDRAVLEENGVVTAKVGGKHVTFMVEEDYLAMVN